MAIWKNITEQIDEIVLLAKEREENITEQIDEIELLAKEREENITEQIDEIVLLAKEREENITYKKEEDENKNEEELKKSDAISIKNEIRRILSFLAENFENDLFAEEFIINNGIQYGHINLLILLFFEILYNGSHQAKFSQQPFLLLD